MFNTYFSRKLTLNWLSWTAKATKRRTWILLVHWLKKNKSNRKESFLQYLRGKIWPFFPAISDLTQHEILGQFRNASRLIFSGVYPFADINLAYRSLACDASSRGRKQWKRVAGTFSRQRSACTISNLAGF